MRLKLKSTYNDGTSHLEFTPEQFIKRLIALIPPPRQNFIRYYGLFGARHKNRAEITSKAKAKKEKPKSKVIYQTPWADLLRRVFKYEVSYCDHCGEKLRFVQAVTSSVVCAKILNHLDMSSEQMSASSPRGSPEEEHTHEQNDDFFNQESSW